MWARHSLVTLTPAGWDALCARLEDDAARRPGEREALARWRQQGWPLVLRRTEPDLAAEEISLGLPAPPPSENACRIRLPLRVPLSAVASITPPLRLAAAIAAAPPAWQTHLAELDQAAGAAGLALHVFGSLAMQSLTGLAYLHPDSDVDLYCCPPSAVQLQALLQLLERHAKHLSLDGEIGFPNGQAVAWREWAAPQAQDPRDRVLAKHEQGVSLVTREVLLAALGAAHA